MTRTLLLAALLTGAIALTGCKTVPEAPPEQPIPPATEPEPEPRANGEVEPEGGDDFGSYELPEVPPAPGDGEDQTVHLGLVLEVPEYAFLRDWGKPTRSTEFKHGERETLLDLEPRIEELNGIKRQAGFEAPAIEEYPLREDVWVRDGYEFVVWMMFDDMQWSALTAASIRTP